MLRFIMTASLCFFPSSRYFEVAPGATVRAALRMYFNIVERFYARSALVFSTCCESLWSGVLDGFFTGCTKERNRRIHHMLAKIPSLY